MSTQLTKAEDISKVERIVMLALHTAKTRGVSGTNHLWLQKVAFLFIQRMEELANASPSTGSSYVAHDYGPYSDEVAGSIDTLCQDRLASVDSTKNLRLTPAGERLATQIESLKPKAAQAMESILDTVGDLSDTELILYVYATNPEWARESIVQRILKDSNARLRLARKLYLNHRVTASRAAQVAGLPLDRFSSSDLTG